MRLKDIMTTDVLVVPPDTPVSDVARQMELHDIGAIPVCSGRKLLGMITDRDIVLKVVARGLDVNDMRASDVMMSPIIWCYEDCELDEAARLMEVRQIRRLVVVDRDKNLVGVVTLGDLAVRAGEHLAGSALEKISEPSRSIH